MNNLVKLSCNRKLTLLFNVRKAAATTCSRFNKKSDRHCCFGSIFSFNSNRNIYTSSGIESRFSDYYRPHNEFVDKHIGPDSEQQQAMLQTLGYKVTISIIEGCRGATV